MSAPWFDPIAYAWIPGTLMGVAGGTLGGIAGALAPRGRARGAVLALFAVAIVASVALIVAGAIALAGGQPYGVWYGLGLPGVLGAAIFGGLAPVVRRRYAEAESRKLRAADLL